MSACQRAYPPKIFICTNTQPFYNPVPSWQSREKGGAELGVPLLAGHIAFLNSSPALWVLRGDNVPRWRHDQLMCCQLRIQADVQAGP